MKTVGMGLAHRPHISFTEFEAIADAAMRAMFLVDGRIEPTASATYPVGGYSDIIATRRFKAQFRKDLRAANFVIWTKGRKWA